MAKRFIDTGLFNKEWFMSLSPKLKCAWFYMITNCNHAGVIDINSKLISLAVGEKISKDELVKNFKLYEVSSNKFFIIGFIEYQYGVEIEKLNSNNKVHNSILKILNKINIPQGASMGHRRPYDGPSPQGAKDKDKDKDKDKERDSKGGKSALAEELSIREGMDEVLEKCSERVLKAWTQAYPDRDWMVQNLLDANAWCAANPHKAPKSNYSAFYGRWLSKQWERHRVTLKSNPKPPDRSEQAIRELLAVFLGFESDRELPNEVLNGSKKILAKLGNTRAFTDWGNKILDMEKLRGMDAETARRYKYACLKREFGV